MNSTSVNTASSVSARIASIALASRFEDLPAAVVAHAKRLIADTLLVAFAAASKPTNRALADVYRQIGGTPQASTWERETTHLPAMHAAWINALYASALDYDSLNGNLHADAVCLPAAWAIAVHARRPGRELLSAMVTAAELMTRLALARTEAQKGWSATAIYGGVGAAIGASKLLGLDATGMRHAIGLAVAQAAGTQQANIERALSKRMLPAFAARNGVAAAFLAQAQASAPELAFEGQFGLRALYESGSDDAWLTQPFQEFIFMRTALKRYPVCACSHAAIDACKAIVARDGEVQASDIARVTVQVSPFMHRLVGAPFSTDGDLEVVAQFSIQYAVAVALSRGDVGLRALDVDQVGDPVIAQLAQRVSVEIDDTQRGELTPASVALFTHDGRRLFARCERFPGGPDAPLSDAEHLRKLLDCAAVAGLPVSVDHIDGFLGLIDRIYAADDMHEFERDCFAALRVARAG